MNHAADVKLGVLTLEESYLNMLNTHQIDIQEN